MKVRWGTTKKNLSVFIPSKGGLVLQGAGISSVYPKDFHNFAPRLGFAYKAKESGDLVVARDLESISTRPI